MTRLTDTPEGEGTPSWSRDGKKIAFNSSRDGNWQIFTMNSDGSNQARLTNNTASDGEPNWGP